MRSGIDEHLDQPGPAGDSPRELADAVDEREAGLVAGAPVAQRRRGPDAWVAGAAQRDVGHGVIFADRFSAGRGRPRPRPKPQDVAARGGQEHLPGARRDPEVLPTQRGEALAVEPGVWAVNRTRAGRGPRTAARSSSSERKIRLDLPRRRAVAVARRIDDHPVVVRPRRRSRRTTVRTSSTSQRTGRSARPEASAFRRAQATAGLRCVHVRDPRAGPGTGKRGAARVAEQREQLRRPTESRRRPPAPPRRAIPTSRRARETGHLAAGRRPALHPEPADVHRPARTIAVPCPGAGVQRSGARRHSAAASRRGITAPGAGRSTTHRRSAPGGGRRRSRSARGRPRPSWWHASPADPARACSVCRRRLVLIVVAGKDVAVGRPVGMPELPLAQRSKCASLLQVQGEAPGRLSRSGCRSCDIDVRAAPALLQLRPAPPEDGCRVSPIAPKQSAPTAVAPTDGRARPAEVPVPHRRRQSSRRRRWRPKEPTPPRRSLGRRMPAPDPGEATDDEPPRWTRPPGSPPSSVTPPTLP